MSNQFIDHTKYSMQAGQNLFLLLIFGRVFNGYSWCTIVGAGQKIKSILESDMVDMIIK